jgi:hypothetical protein
MKQLIYKICGKDLMPMQEEEKKKKNDERDNVELNVVVSVIELPLIDNNKKLSVDLFFYLMKKLYVNSNIQ